MAGQEGRRSWGRVIFGAPRAIFRSVGRIGARHVDDMHDAAEDAYVGLQPKGRLSRRSFEERYRDGGIERFRQLACKLSEDQIGEAYRAWKRDSIVYMAATVICLAAVPAMLIICHVTSAPSLVGLCILAVVLLALSVRADYRAWQIRQRRIGSLRSYFTGDLPPNMHLISKDDE